MTSHPDLKRTLVAMSERTGLSISQVTDEVLYAGLVEMQELDELSSRKVQYMGHEGAHWPRPLTHKVVRSMYLPRCFIRWRCQSDIRQVTPT